MSLKFLLWKFLKLTDKESERYALATLKSSTNAMTHWFLWTCITNIEIFWKNLFYVHFYIYICNSIYMYSVNSSKLWTFQIGCRFVQGASEKRRWRFIQWHRKNMMQCREFKNPRGFWQHYNKLPAQWIIDKQIIIHCTP